MFHNFERFRRTIHMTVAAAIILGYSTVSLCGQDRYSLGVSADATGGGKSPDFTGINISQKSQDFAAFLATYPSLKFTARGEHSSLDSTYGFGYEKSYFDPSYESRSHSASVRFSSQLGPKWKLNLSDSFSMTSDISSYRLLSGATAPDPAQFQFAFTPVFARSNRNNTANVSLNRTFNKQSSLAVSGSYSTLDYPGGSLATGVLSDQKRISATATYTYSGEHYTWSFGYSGARFNFSRFQNSLNHSAHAGYSYQFSRALSLRMEVGPSYLQSLENIKSPMGVNANVTLERKVQQGSFGLTVSQTSGDTSGLGSVSTFREAGLNMSRKVRRNVSISANASAFDTEGLQVNSLSARGGSAGGSIGYLLGRDWSLNWGGQYQHYEGYSTSGYDQKRIFMTLRYSKPELLRF